MTTTWNPPAALGQTVAALTNHGWVNARIIGVSIGTCCPYSVAYYTPLSNELKYDTCGTDAVSPWVVPFRFDFPLDGEYDVTPDGRYIAHS